MKKIIYVSLIVVMTITSCNDILELTPLDRLSDATVWEDEKLIELYVNSSYHSVEHGFYHLLMWSSLCDETYLIHDGGSYMYLKGELTSDNVSVVGGGWMSIGPLFDYWSKGYGAIRDINIFFDKIDDAPVEEALKTRMYGEMKFLRAFVYAHLIWRYGGVPIITDVFELGGDYSVTRSSYEDCVTFICSDLDDAIAALDTRQPADQLGRASGDAARALKSRVLLYAASLLNNPSNDLSKWQEAADAAEYFINLTGGGSYSLNDDYQKTFLEDNNEIIYARYFTQANAHDMHLFNGRNGSEGWGGNCPTQNIVDDYEMAATGLLPSDPASGFDPANPYAGRDPRFYASILYDGAVWMGRDTETFIDGMDSRGGPIQAWNGTLTGYYLKKFLLEDIPPSGSSINPTNPYIFFRYGEMLLNYAEAKFELGDEATAQTYLNMIRSRNGVNMPPITATGDELRQKIYHERRIELVFEGHRFFDVRRWKIAMETENKDLLAMVITKQEDGTKTYEITNLLTRAFIEQHYLLPIPRAEINKSLESLTQNPGY